MGRRRGHRSHGSRPSRRSKGVVCYIAYNHRFEPHFVRMREAGRLGTLGALYHCRMFYGNGTARLVREFANGATRALASCPISARICSTPRNSGSATSARISGSYPAAASRTARPITSCSPRGSTTPAARAGDDAAQLAQPLHLRPVCRERLRAYSLAVQMGPVVIHITHAACCRADARPRIR